MKVLRVVNDKKHGVGHFTIWVWARDDPLHWKECPFSFAYESGQVYFLFGGQKSEKRLIGKVESRNDAVKKAEVYLEGWLRECKAID